MNGAHAVSEMEKEATISPRIWGLYDGRKWDIKQAETLRFHSMPINKSKIQQPMVERPVPNSTNESSLAQFGNSYPSPA